MFMVHSGKPTYQLEHPSILVLFSENDGDSSLPAKLSVAGNERKLLCGQDKSRRLYPPGGATAGNFYSVLAFCLLVMGSEEVWHLQNIVVTLNAA